MADQDEEQIKCPICGGTTSPQSARCEVCGLDMDLPQIEPNNDAAVQSTDLKECPFCAEVIKRKAIKCKHCGADLVTAKQDAPVISRADEVVPHRERRLCPMCRSAQPAVKKRKGSILVAIILLLVFLLPGIIYCIVYSGYTYECPDCGYRYGDAS
ncbi:MAG: zinc ribbon domain-containing protein [Planctomycetota bacterium]|nr:zinc ribbon domain-containing protein [Planctomycetota bacterium]